MVEQVTEAGRVTPHTAAPLVARRQVAACLGGIGAVLLFGIAGCASGSSGSSPGSSPGPLITQADLVGTWTVSFQWQGRTPGVLTLIINSDYSYTIPASPGVGAASGTLQITIDGASVTLVLSEDGTTWLGTATSSTAMSGSWTATSGKTATFSACKGTQVCSTSSSSSSGSSGGSSGGCGGCSGSCSGGCSNGCSGGCQSSCGSGCSGLCTSSCTGCGGSCQGAS